ncbi:hypothetical protein GCL60_05835 [Silvanigrella paludirubra]|uniref:Uncharacterized protein n=1 Tax=Silvanigrella paludirubra TaxID=2499159 RepID=A0A6N6VY38_9BACT|nr:hypothetical protein [Silvanigrella paludirubra]KAB8039782.1 hypothetical protein GCL60_05835 [Silvanigrella paludirubra]
MVFSQSLPRISKNTIKKNHLSKNSIKSTKPILEDLIHQPSFSLVSLFLKFIENDFYAYGDLSLFKSYFENNIQQSFDYLIQTQKLKKDIYSNKIAFDENEIENQNSSNISHNNQIQIPEFKINDYINYEKCIKEQIQNKNIIYDDTDCHNQENNPFINKLEKDVQNLIQDKSYSNFYFIQDLSQKQNTYGLFVYYRFEKCQIVFYNTKTGLKLFELNELSFLNENINKLLNKDNNYYFSFKLKILHEKNETVVNHKLNETIFQSILLKSIKEYTNFINSKKTTYLSSNSKEDYLYCQTILKKEWLDTNVIFSEFFTKYSSLIHKLKSNMNVINEKSFWIFFLINFYSFNNEIIKNTLNTLDPFLGKEKISVFLYNYFNKKTLISSLQSKKIICLIILETYKNLSLCGFRIPFYSFINVINLGKHKFTFGKNFLESFRFDFESTIQEWNEQNIIYNERYISKRYNTTYQSIIGFSSIGKLNIESLTSDIPSYTQLENHFLTATNNNDNMVTKFCLGSLNKNNLHQIDNFLNLYLKDRFSNLLNPNNKFTFIQKISPQIHDIMVIYYIDYSIEKIEKTKLNNPIYLCYNFTVITKNNKIWTKNFNFGFLNHTIHNKYSSDINEIILKFVADKNINQYFSNKKHNEILYENLY